MTAANVVLRITLDGEWPASGSTLRLERKFRSRRSYETLMAIHSPGHITDEEAHAFLAETSEVLHDLLTRMGYGAGYLQLESDEPF